MFVMLEPITLPTTISDAPLSTDRIEVVSSGSDVPKDTRVTPIINGLIPQERPIRSALSMNLLEPMIRAARLTMKVKKSMVTIED